MNVTKPLDIFLDFFDDCIPMYIDDIRGDNPVAFTRKRYLTPDLVLAQMFNAKGRSQHFEIVDFYDHFNKSPDVSRHAFMKARMKFNPEAVHAMLLDFMSQIYDECDSLMTKYNGYLVTAIDGSDITVPSSEENDVLFGKSKGNGDNQPTMGKISVHYDCINELALDIQIRKYKHSERDLSCIHLKGAKETLRQPTITIFDRGYASVQSMVEMGERGEKFLFRVPSTFLKRFFDQLGSNDDQVFGVTFDGVQTNEYRKDKQFRQKLTSTTFKWRFAKVTIVGTDGVPYDEYLITNLFDDEFSLDQLKELYHMRWSVESVYNVMKNKMKLEEFSGYRSTLVRQDIYCTAWLYNLVKLQQLTLSDDEKLNDECNKHPMKLNTNATIGYFKRLLVKIIYAHDRNEKENIIRKMNKEILKHLVPIRPGRKRKRKKSGNKTRRSYRYSY